MALALVFIKPPSAIVGLYEFHPYPTTLYSLPIFSPKTPYCLLSLQ